MFVLLQTCWISAILFSPLQQLARRLAFVVLGVLILIGLSEISKLTAGAYRFAPDPAKKNEKEKRKTKSKR
jgi:hypothetical protein